ncbi:hypothetical protein [Cohnella zeiphila]|uniref:ABM domain-containing protein n=1 Tax=Cohnella zeiphila TaxID=2761120 RepID=A0A7X0SIR4_9BACL|nr:hypothetical protein [Cohnella zeiphila]MBB6730712.1 hypothetical protein [Cohnella zeiphila]
MIVFCEYRVTEENREAYLGWVRACPERWSGVELAENTVQPGVFVELRRALNEEEAARMEKERREGRSWEEMERWVKGGRTGVRVWMFRPVVTGSE